MEIYFDISDIIDWKVNHLTGIQRTAVGLLNGLVENEVDLTVIAYDDIINGFYVVDPWAISPEVFKYFTNKTKNIICNKFNSLHNENRVVSQEEFQMPPATTYSKVKKILIEIRRQTIWRIGFLKNITLLIMGKINKTIRSFGKKKQIVEINNGDIILFLGANGGIEKRNKKLVELKKEGARLYTIIYDIIPIVHPEWGFQDIYKAFTKWTRKWIEYTDTIFTISEFSKNEIISYCNRTSLDNPDISVIRLADTVNKKISTVDILPRFVPDNDFFICVCTIDPRKNQLLLYQAWQILEKKFKNNFPHIICIGSIHPQSKDLVNKIKKDPILNRFIHFFDDIADEELDWYYKNCKATIYPSVYEGWGLPVGESLGHGKLCLASNSTSIPEIGGELVQYFDPYNPLALVSLVERSLTDHEWVAYNEDKIKKEYLPIGWESASLQIKNKISL